MVVELVDSLASKTKSSSSYGLCPVELLGETGEDTLEDWDGVILGDFTDGFLPTTYLISGLYIDLLVKH